CKLLIQDFAASFDSAVPRVHDGSFDAVVVSLVSAAFVPADSSSSIPADNVPADSSSSISTDYVSAGHVLVSADRDRIC
ncbi:hypothetical protein Tco_0443595, partial [Tanacetum coccineum]